MAWSPFKPRKHGGQLGGRKQGQPIYKRSHAGGPAEDVNRKLRGLQPGVKQWVSEDKVLELEGGPQQACSWTRGWWVVVGGEGGVGCLPSRAASSYKAHPVRRGDSLSSQVGAWLQKSDGNSILATEAGQ